MAGWILIACLKQLFAEFNQIAPGRDHASDGSIGDTAHQHEVSDHNPDETGSVPIHDADHINEVHAIDVDSDLRVPGLAMEDVVQLLLARCRSGAETRLRYIIYNRRIWEASNGWQERPYTGASAHTEHAHFSASYDTDREASTASWHLEDLVADNGWDDKIVTNPKWNKNAETTPKVTPAFALYQALDYAHSAAVLAGEAKAATDRTDAAIADLQAAIAGLTTAVADLGERLGRTT